MKEEYREQLCPGRSTKHTTGCALSHISKLFPASRGFCGVANQKPWAVVKLYIVQSFNHKMAKTKKKRNGEQGKWDEEATGKRI